MISSFQAALKNAVDVVSLCVFINYNRTIRNLFADSLRIFSISVIQDR